MATKRSLILNSADQNSNKKQRAVTEVNPKVDRTFVAELGEITLTISSLRTATSNFLPTITVTLKKLC